MKTFNNIKTYFIASLIILFAFSCEKESITNDVPITTTQEEGFFSKTGNNDKTVDFTEDENSAFETVLHRSYSSDLTEEEAKQKFDKEVEAYLNERRMSRRDVSTEWYYRVYTYTGTQTHNNTDGNVRVKVRFKTNRGHLTHTRTLDNPGNDREKGSHDWYLNLRTAYPGKAVSWVNVKSAKLQLQGKDGWFVKKFRVFIVKQDQTMPATGYSRLYSTPNVWLDNKTKKGWDTYNTGNRGSGKIQF